MRTKANTCSGKVKHLTQTRAIIALKKIRNAGLSPYHCPFCGKWHIGNDRNKIQERITQLLEEPKPRRKSKPAP